MFLRIIGLALLGAALAAGNPSRADRPPPPLSELRSAAEAGDGRAMLALGRLFLKGLGAPQDYVLAHMWFNLAAARGGAEAAKERDALAARMTSRQIAAAHDRARSWRPETGIRGVSVRAVASAVGAPPPRAIREAQTLLAALGYAPGAADGRWGARTAAAYLMFIRDVGLTGQELTAEAMRTMRKIAKQRGAAPSNDPPPRPAAAQGAGVRARPDGRAGRGQRNIFARRVGRPLSTAARDLSVGWTDLHHAAVLDLPGVVSALIEAGMMPDVRLKDDSSPFGERLTRTLGKLWRGKSFRGWRADGETPSMIAAILDSRAALAALVDGGADMGAGNVGGDTPLHYAAFGNARGAAEWLVAHGAEVDARNAEGETPLHYAAQTDALAAARILMARGADVGAKDRGGETPLHYAALANARRVAESLAARGADVGAKDRGGETPMHYAAFGDARGMAEWLAARGADIGARDNGGHAPLHAAARGDARGVAEWLLSRGADSRAADGDGKTPQDLAISPAMRAILAGRAKR